MGSVAGSRGVGVSPTWVTERCPCDECELRKGLLSALSSKPGEPVDIQTREFRMLIAQQLDRHASISRSVRLRGPPGVTDVSCFFKNDELERAPKSPPSLSSDDEQQIAKGFSPLRYRPSVFRPIRWKEFLFSGQLQPLARTRFIPALDAPLQLSYTFLVCCGRSGSTALSEVLAQIDPTGTRHLVLDEPRQLYLQSFPWLDAYSVASAASGDRLDDPLSHDISSDAVERFAERLAELCYCARSMRPDLNSSTGEDASPSTPQRLSIIEKHPDMVFHLSFISSLFYKCTSVLYDKYNIVLQARTPDETLNNLPSTPRTKPRGRSLLHFIWLRRDPRDVAISIHHICSDSSALWFGVKRQKWRSWILPWLRRCGDEQTIHFADSLLPADDSNQVNISSFGHIEMALLEWVASEMAMEEFGLQEAPVANVDDTPSFSCSRSRITQVCYEDLIASPAETTAKVLSRLNVELPASTNIPILASKYLRARPKRGSSFNNALASKLASALTTIASSAPAASERIAMYPCCDPRLC